MSHTIDPGILGKAARELYDTLKDKKLTPRERLAIPPQEMPAQEPGAGIHGQDFVSISGGTGYVINPNTDSPQEAWKFLAYMMSQEQMTAFQDYQPGIRSRDDVPIPDSAFLTETSQTLLPLTTARPNDANYNSVSQEIQRMTEAVVSGELSPEEAMAQYKASVIGIVGEENTVSLL
mgnify:CR=1 FL=1